MEHIARALSGVRPRIAVPLIAGAFLLPPCASAIRADTAQRSPGSGTPALAATLRELSADVTLTQGLLDGKGQPVGRPLPATRYRWQRKNANGRWKTTMTIVSGVRPPARFLSGATRGIEPTVASIEDDGDGSGPRFYDSQHRRLRSPGAADIKPLNAPGLPDALRLPAMPRIPSPASSPLIDGDWTRSLVLGRQDGKARRAEAERKFGPPAGRIRGLDRFLTTTGEGTLEVLMEPDSGVVREWNRVKDGTLDTHGTAVYEAFDADLLLRRTARLERLLPNGSGNRMGTQVDLQNVRIVRR